MGTEQFILALTFVFLVLLVLAVANYVNERRIRRELDRRLGRVSFDLEDVDIDDLWPEDLAPQSPQRAVRRQRDDGADGGAQSSVLFGQPSTGSRVDTSKDRSDSSRETETTTANDSDSWDGDGGGGD